MARRYFGTDGVRGIVGESLTVDLVERLGRAAALWSGAERVLRRARHPRLGRRARGGVRARRSPRPAATAVLGGVLPTPAVALARARPRGRDLRVPQPARVQRRQVLRRGGQQAHRRGRGADRGAARRRARRAAAARSSAAGRRRARYIDYVLERFGSDLTGLRIVVDCANGAYSGLAPERVRAARRRRRRDRRTSPTGRTSTSAAAPPTPPLLQRTVVARRLRPRDRLRRRRRPDARRRRARRARRRRRDRRDPRARPRRRPRRGHADDEPRLPRADARARRSASSRPTSATATCSRRSQREGGVLGGEQSGHIIYLRDHVTGDGLAPALLLCAALQRPDAERGRRGRCRATPSARRTSRSRRRSSPRRIREAVERARTPSSAMTGRVLVRPSGTEPLDPGARGGRE